MIKRTETSKIKAAKIAQELNIVISEYMRLEYPECGIDEDKLVPEQQSWGTAYHTIGFDVCIHFDETEEYLDKENKQSIKEEE